MSDVEVRYARGLAGVLLADLPDRWAHTAGVAARAARYAAGFGRADADLLVAAAWLHDVGYADTVRDTGFHPLDGARYLDRAGWPPRLTALVAHHSGARFLAREVGLAGELGAYPREDSPLADALTAADQTVGPRGEPTTVDARIAEVLHRHGPGSPYAGARLRRAPYLVAATRRAAARLAAAARPGAAARPDRAGAVGGR
ncbi:metal-dependent phosphohydrolase, HD subdomain protein [Pilimelia anulata]|uniref:Metal-dependent phosphohydrolase, HD subdomain protein n=1 Tax=Pilimelia anulata TaxID=53371 RepID=A0A8J3FD55_9ACTN|nr:metal-dependent phosphohydrolase, HD subdomain protein [Pilimelia anulata]